MAFRTVFVKDGEKISLKLDNLVVRKCDEEFYIPLIDIENIILEGRDTTITSRVLAKLAFYNIDVVICDNNYHPCGIYLGMGQYHRTAKRNAWQAQWTVEQKKNAWQVVVRQKIINQIYIAEMLSRDHGRLEKMTDMLEQIHSGDESNREGHVAKLYFNTIYGLGFTREDDSFPNACMNYGYSIIRAQVARYVVAQGLIPSLGIFHRNEYNSFNLVDDLMEPFRPLFDWYMHKHLLEEEEQYLTYDNRLVIIDFLNQKIRVNNKKVYLNQAINMFVKSFIIAMETGDFSRIIDISAEEFVGV